MLDVGTISPDKHSMWLTGSLSTTDGRYRMSDTSVIAPVRNDSSRLVIGVSIQGVMVTELDSISGTARLKYPLFPSQVDSSTSDTRSASLVYRGTTTYLHTRWESRPNPTQIYFDPNKPIVACSILSSVWDAYFGKILLRKINADTVIVNVL